MTQELRWKYLVTYEFLRFSHNSGSLGSGALTMHMENVTRKLIFTTDQEIHDFLGSIDCSKLVSINVERVEVAV